MKNSLILLFLLTVWTNSNAQMVDVFTNTIYPDVRNYVLKEKSDLDHTPDEIEITQVHLTTSNLSDEFYKKVRAIAIDKLSNTFEYQKLLQDVQRQIKDLVEYRSKMKKEMLLNAPPSFKRLNIEGKSILNHQLMLDFQYEFTLPSDYRGGVFTFTIHRYYQVDMKKQTIQPFNEHLSAYTKEIPPIIVEKLKRAYAISTRKIDAYNIDTLTVYPSFETFVQSMNINDLELVPYFSGAVVSFKDYSPSSIWFYGEIIQLFLTYEEMQSLKGILPYFNTFYPHSSKILPVNPVLMTYKDILSEIFREKLADDFLKEPQKGIQNIYVDHYNVKRDTVYRIEKYNYSPTGLLEEVTTMNADSILQKREVYRYNEENQLKNLVKFGKYNLFSSVISYQYSNGLLSNEEHVYQDERRKILSWEDRTEEYIFEMNIEFTYYFNNGGYMYRLPFSFLDDSRTRREEITYEFVKENEHHNAYLIAFFDEKNHFIGYKSNKRSSYPPQALVNEKGQIIEYHSEGERSKKFYSYNDEGQRTNSTVYYDNGLVKTLDYHYRENESIPYLIEQRGKIGDVDYRIKME